MKFETFSPHTKIRKKSSCSKTSYRFSIPAIVSMAGKLENDSSNTPGFNVCKVKFFNLILITLLQLSTEVALIKNVSKFISKI